MLEPIWLYEGKILDGRNRYRACVELGLKAPVRRYIGDTPAKFVVSMNYHRRHLTKIEIQKLWVTKLEPLYKAEAKERQTLSKGQGIKVASFDATLKKDHRSNRYGKAVQAAAKDLGVSASLLERTSRVEKIERGERRHLTPGQRASLVDEMRPNIAAEAKARQANAKPGARGGNASPINGISETTDEALGKIAGVGKTLVSYARRIA